VNLPVMSAPHAPDDPWEAIELLRPQEPPKPIASSKRLSRHRWTVERSLSRLLGFRRLGAR